MRLSIDTGGTFTDFVVEDDRRQISIHKTPTTPKDPIDGILAGIRELADKLEFERPQDLLASVSTIVHATTVATNAILTGGTAGTAFITTAGHPDVLMFRMGGREDPFRHDREFPQPYVPRALTFEVSERIDYRGQVIRPLDQRSAAAVAQRLLELGVEAAGVCLLWSVVNPSHELAVREVIGAAAPDIEVTLSHQINPVIREYHRASAACIDASLKPLMSRFMGQLRGRLADAGFTGRLLVASASGGLLEPEWLAAAPIHSINSGPALAPVAGRHHAGAETGIESAVIVDAGGTSFDVSVVRGGRIPRTRETWLGDRFVGHITGFPSVDVRTTGAGGGSIASVDPGGLLSVGPLSAGSMPGPVCYGRGGTWPTVTDAAVVLGYLNAERLVELGIDVDVEGAGAAIEQQIGRPLRLNRDAAAAAIIRVLTEQMVHAVEEVTIDQGIDPRTAVLVSGGGAAGFNIVAIAARLGCPRLVIPSSCSALSATGGLLSEISAEHAIALLTTTAAFDFAAVNAALRELSDRCATLLDGSRDASREPVVELLAEARYPGQVWELELPLRRARFVTPSDLAELSEDFHRLHEEVFAVRDQNSPIEIVGWRARVRGSAGSSGSLVSAEASDRGECSRRMVHLGGTGSQELPVFELASLTETTGPAIIELPGTTVVLDATAVATRTESGNMVVIPPQVDRWTAQELIGAR